MKVKDLVSGSKTAMPLLIARFVRGVTQNGAAYVSITFQDNTGEIEGKIWDVKPEIEAIIKVGLIAEVTMDVNPYRNSLQARVQKIAISEQENYKLEDFVDSGSYDVVFLKTEIEAMVQDIQDPIIKALVIANLDKVGEQFYQYPAATRNHHAFVGGLATHVYGMAKLAYSMCALYPIYNRDLLVAGVILHDMGKVEEYTSPVLSEYSNLGKLVGHISIMHANFTEIANKLGYGDTEQALLIRHMILSHHGQYEYGSPVQPMLKEAEMLNFIDNIDARTNMIEKCYENLEAGTFSTRIFALDNRNFYKAKDIE